MVDAAKLLLDELESSYPEACKVPGREGGYIRVPVSVNVEWYRRFCGSFLVSRRKYPKPRTLIRRQHTISALRRVIAGRMDSVYVERLRPFLDEANERMAGCGR